MSTLHGERKADRAGRVRFDSLPTAGGSAALLLVGCWAMLSLGGCPPGGGIDGVDNGVVPVPVAGFSVTITSTEGILQRNELDFSINFERSSTLAVVVTQPTEDPQEFTVVWSIDASAEMVLAFNVGATFAQATTGESVSVEVVSAPREEVTQVIRAAVTLEDGLELDEATIALTIRPDIGDDPGVTSLESHPWADPAVGLNSDNQFVLNAGVTGNKGNFVVRWTEVLTGLDANIQLPADLTGETLTITVAGPVSGVVAFRSSVTEAVAATGEQITTQGIVNVFLGQAALTLDAAVTRLLVSPTASSVGIRTTRIGGVDDVGATADTFFYAFQILDENGLDVTSTAAITPDVSVADDDIVNDWTISGLSPEGDYRILVTVADSEDLLMGAASVTVSLADGLSLAMEPQFDRVGAGTGFSLRTVRGGGTPNYTYTFDAIDSNGAAAATTFTPASGSVDNDLVNNWALTGFAAPGTYRIFGTVTDGSGNSVTASTDVVVGDVFTLDVQSTDIVLEPGQSATLTFDRTGGAPNFSYAFAETSPGADSGAFDSASPTTVADDATVVWTAPNAPGAGAVEGVYLIEVTATDTRGLRSTDSISILVQEDEPLSLDVRSTANIVAPAGMVTLTFDQSGGVGSYSYAFSTTGPNGGSAFGDGSPKAAAGDTTTTWTAPAASGTTEGTYRVDVEVTDALGNTARDSVFLIVQSPDILSVDVQAARVQIGPGSSGTDLMRTVRTGGVQAGSDPRFTYTWQIIDSAGNDDTGDFGAITSSDDAARDDIVIDWTFATITATADTYRFFCTIVDALGNRFVASAEILIADTLSLDVQAARVQIGPGSSGTDLMRTVRTGGVQAGSDPRFTYTWQIIDSAGNDDTGDFGAITSSDDAARDDIVIDWTFATITATADTYRFFCTIVDALGNRFVASAEILIAEPLSIDLDAESFILGLGVPVRITGSVIGGVLGYDYAFSAEDPQGDAAGAFDTMTFDNSTNSSETVTYLPPSIPGAYRVRLSVTDRDGSGNQESQTLHLWVTADAALVAVDAFTDEAAPQNQANLEADIGVIVNSADLTSGAPNRIVIDQGNIGGFGGTLALTAARNLIFFFDDADDGATLDVTSVVVTGVNARGDTIQDSFDPTEDGNGDAFVTRSLPFKSIINIVIDYTGEEAGDADSVKIGIGNLVGLSARFGATRDSFHIVATGNPVDENATFFDVNAAGPLPINFADTLDIPTTSQQSIMFDSDENGILDFDGAQDYVVQIGPDLPVMTLNVTADDYTLVAGSDTANVTMDVEGGVPPYTYSYFDVGLNSPGVFDPTTDQTGIPGDAAANWDPPAPTAAPEIYAIVVRVVDSLGNEATGSIAIRVD